MSLEAMLWAFKQDITPSSKKFVLVAMANFTGAEGRCYSAVSTICRLTNQHDETVRKAIDSLVSDGTIQDTGKTTGRTGQVKIYQLPPEACEFTERPRESGVLKDPDNTRTRPVQDPAKTPENRGQNKEQGTRTENKTKTEFPSVPSSLATDEFVSAWQKWLEDRRERKKPVTANAAILQFRNMQKWGVKKSIIAIETAIEKGWQGIFEPKGVPNDSPRFSNSEAVDSNPFAALTS